MAQDLTNKRKNLANNAITHAERLVDALNALVNLRQERGELAVDFQDPDFAGANIHITPGMMGTLFDFVVPSLLSNFQDAANGGRNEQILLQVRR